MKRFYTLLFITILSAHSIFAQTDLPEEAKQYKNCVYGTAGWGIMYGTFIVNYERNIHTPKRKLMYNLNLRFAYGRFVAWGVGGPTYISSLQFLSGKYNNHFETSLGIGVMFDNVGYDVNKSNAEYTDSPKLSFTQFTLPIPIASIGYRYQNPNKRFIFRTGVGWPETLFVSFGYAFN